MLDTKTI